MLDILFGWRKASKCKKQIRHLRRRLKLLMNKRGSMIRQSRQDVAQLVKLGYDEAALQRAELLFKDESLMGVYDLLDHFCEFILAHMPYIRRSKDCPNDINEVVSSLVYASARCGDLPELLVIRELFGQHYGQRFTTAALELFPGNLVNPQLKEHLNIQSVPEYVKHKLVDEITRDYCLQPEILAIEYPSEFIEDMTHEVRVKDRTDEIQEPQVGALYPTMTDRKPMSIGSSSSSKNSFSTTSHSPRGTDTTSTSVASSIAHQSSSSAFQSPEHNQLHEIGKFIEMEKQDKSTTSDLETKEIQGMHNSYNTNSDNKEKRVNSSSSSQNSDQFLEETLVCLDDVEEYQSFIPNTGDSQDQRLFKFKFSMPQKNCTSKDCSMHSDGDENQSPDDELRSYSRKARSSGETSRRMSMSREIYSMNDIDYAHYYDELSNKNSAIPKHQYPGQRKLRKMSSPPLQRDPFYCPPTIRRDLNDNTDSCISRNSDKGDLGSPMKLNLDIKDTVAARRSFPEKQTQDLVQGIRTPESCSSCSKDHCDIINRSSTRKELQPPYIRAMLQPPYIRAITMPSKRNKESSQGKMARSNTCISPHPNHVHPKLPDYDDLATKFLAVKKEHIRENCP